MAATRRIYDNTYTCSVCGEQCSRLSLNRCRTCYAYYYAHGVDRPPELHERSRQRRRCECGRPAVQRIRLQTAYHFEDYDLCSVCYRLETGAAHEPNQPSHLALSV